MKLTSDIILTPLRREAFMSRQDLTRRLAKLEAAHAPPSGRFNYGRLFHHITADSEAEADAECQAMLADGRAQPGDNFILHIIVTPPAREAT